jgi:anti-anti-sigma regulatory factor
VHLAGVLDEGSANPLKERINTLISTTGDDVIIHFGDLTTVTPQAMQLLLEGTRPAFEQRRAQLILQEVDESLSGWLAQVPVPSYATVIMANSEVSATGD